MIHELLFNLWNNPGHDFLSDESDWTHLFELPEFLHPGEKKLLQIIIEIGVDYHKITAYTNEVFTQSAIIRTTNKEENTKTPVGLYLKAFCYGVQEALMDYREEILKLEDTFLENPQLSLTYILSCVEKYRGLFGILKSMISKIQLENLHGCLLMSGLHKYINCGIDRIEKAANTIIKSINTVFYQHLSNWIVCGDLIDPYDEFFIRDGKVPDDNFMYPEQLLEHSKDTVLSQKKSKIRRPPPVRKFFIDWDMVPMFISQDMAERILFMGRIVWIVRNDPKKEEYGGDYNTKFRRDIWEGQDVEYYKKIQCLADEKFNGVNFNKTISECRAKLTKYLWAVMLKEGNLVQHLILIRDYFALGRGELFQQFLAILDVSLNDVPSSGLLQHMNFLFQETARKNYGDNDKTYLHFELASYNGEISKSNPWTRLELNFEVEWPLHIIFHPEVITLYNKLFCYLLRLKHTQMNLQKLWSKHMFSKQKIDRRVWTLRRNLTFLVNNLQYYMQVNVIEAQFSTLLKAIESANEFEDIIKIHHDFLANLLSKSFLLMPEEQQSNICKHRLYQMPALQQNVPSKVYNVISNLLELCDEFCTVVGVWEAELTQMQKSELDIYQKRFEIIIETLLSVLHSLHEKVSGGHLLQLLLHLDFNRYFSKNKTELNLTGMFSMIY